MVREELARYLGDAAVPGVRQGTRLNRAARFVFVAERSLPEVAHLTVGRALEFFSQLNLAGWRGEVAAKIVKGVVERLRFLVRRRPRLSDARSQRRDALGRGIAAHPPRQPGRLRAHRRHVHPG